MYFLFPFHLIEKGSKIILYGGGLAGKNYLAQIWETGWCDVVAVCDRNWKEINIRDTKLISPEELAEYDFDIILITQLKREIREEVKRDILTLGIPEEKIVFSYDASHLEWEKPDVGFLCQEDEFSAKKAVADYFEEIDPKLLITSHRIDTSVRYLLFRDFVYDIENKEHLSLFSRFVFCRTGGREAESYYSDAGKQTVQEYINRGRELCKNMEMGGYEPSKFIPLGHNRRPYDGLHRIAAALATGEKIWVKDYDNRDALDCDMGWFLEHGFSVDDRIRILRGFTEIYGGKLGIFVLYAPCKELWSYIEGQIALKYTVVGGVTIDFSESYIAFENMLRQMYWDTNHYSEWLTRKLKMLFLSALQYRIILVSDEGKEFNDFYGSIHNFKKKVRESLDYDIDSNIPVQIHSSDSEDEYKHLLRIFLSANNINREKKRTNKYIRGWFLEALETLKRWCLDNKIDIDDVCIVGSAVMELYGFRDAANINFVCTNSARDNLTAIEKPLELLNGEGYFQDENGRSLNANLIVRNDEYHTIFADVKFCNLEFVYRRKKQLMREKDILDIAIIENYNRFAEFMDEKGALKQQINIELMKRGIKDGV